MFYILTNCSQWHNNHVNWLEGKLISKVLFAILNFFQENEWNNLIIVLFIGKKPISFVRFLEESSAWIKTIRLCLAFSKRRHLQFASRLSKNSKHLIFDPIQTFQILWILNLEKSQGMKGKSDPIWAQTSNTSNISNKFGVNYIVFIRNSIFHNIF